MNQVAQKQVDILIGKYAESHLNRTNEIIHFVCVPAVALSVLGLLWATYPLVAAAMTLVSLVYYFTLSASFGFGMVLMCGAMLAVLYALPQTLVLPLSIAVFVIAWIGQFIGHKIEGRKPSFLDDLRFLLIGPLFVLGFLYRRLHIAY